MTSPIYRGCEFPPGLHYDVERDVWVRRDEDGCVTLGMTDPAQAQCGKFVHLRFKAVGRTLQCGQSAATIESAKWVGPFPTPLTGEIVATNEAAFKRDILLANRDPYGAGWLVRLKPANLGEEWTNLLPHDLAFERYKARIVEKDIRCYRCAD